MPIFLYGYNRDRVDIHEILFAILTGLFSIYVDIWKRKNSLLWYICIYRILTPCKNTDPQESGIGKGHTEPSWRTELSPLSDMTLLLTVSIFVHGDSTCISDVYGKSSSIKYLQSYSFHKNCGQNFVVLKLWTTTEKRRSICKKALL